MRHADVDSVACGGGRHACDAVQAAAGHRLRGVAVDEHPAPRRSVLGDLRPVVTRVRHVPVRQCAAGVEQFGSRGGALVDRLVHGVLMLGHAERRAIRVVAGRPGQPGNIAEEAVLEVGDTSRPHRLVVRHPVPEGCLARGPAELGRLLQQHYFVAQPSAEQCGRQSAAATDDDDIRCDVGGRSAAAAGAAGSHAGICGEPGR